MKQCPACKNWTLDFDDYFSRFRCFNPDCAWMASSSMERQIRILRTSSHPKVINRVNVSELNMTITTSYDEVNDALVFDFCKCEPSFDFPESDGRLLWGIGRVTGEVTGFTILGARKFGVSEICLDLATQKEIIERNIKNQPNSLGNGRPTKVLVNSVTVTRHTEASSTANANHDMANAVRHAIDDFKREFVSV